MGKPKTPKYRKAITETAKRERAAARKRQQTISDARPASKTKPKTCPLAKDIVGIDPPPTLITPEQAIEWLETKALNRTLNDRFVRQLQRDIENNKWDVTGATIKFNTDGKIIDGQHRLWAIFFSDIPCYCHIVRGIKPESIVNIDACQPRSSADQLKILHLVEKNDRIVDGILRTIWSEEQATQAKGVFDFSSPSSRPSNTEIMQLLEEHPGVVDAAAKTHMRPQLVGRATLGYFYYKFCRINRSHADTWIEAFRTGNDLSANSPIGRLRQKLLENRLSRGEKLTRRAIAALIIKSWNLHIQGKDCKKLQWAANEQFPKIRRRA